MKPGLMSLIIVMFVLLLSGCSNADEYDRMLANAEKDGKFVMLELGSVGCIPCEKMKPVMEELRTNYKDRLEVIFIDVRRRREAAKKFGVFVIPTQVFINPEGKEFHRHVGFYPYKEIVPVLKKAGL